MTTGYETAVRSLAEASGANIEIGEDRVATLMVEERAVLLKPSDEAESGLVAFAVVARAEDGAELDRAVLEAALAQNLFGAGTDGGHIGLFGKSLFYSRTIPAEGASPEALAERLMGFSRAANALEAELAGGESPAEGGTPEPTDGMTIPDGLVRV